MSLIKYTGFADQVIINKAAFEQVDVKDQSETVVFSKDNGFVAEVSEGAAKYLRESSKEYSDATDEDRKAAEAKAPKEEVPASEKASSDGDAAPQGSPSGSGPVTTTGGSTTKPAGGGAV